MVTAPTVHIHQPRGWWRRRILYCPVDGRRTECVVTAYLWYDPEVVCARCGEGWSDGQRDPRPFVRGWRPKAQERARRMWDEAPYGNFPTPAEMDAGGSR